MSCIINKSRANLRPRKDGGWSRGGMSLGVCGCTTKIQEGSTIVFSMSLEQDAIQIQVEEQQ